MYQEWRKVGVFFFLILTGNPAGKRSLGRPRREKNMRMDLKETCANTRNWLIKLRIEIIGEHL